MIRAVFDTNLLISGFLWAGAPAQAVFKAIDGRFHLLTTEPLIAELERVLARKKFATRLAAISRTPQSLVSNYRVLAKLVYPADIPLIVTADPTDNAVIACAIGGGADFIVSGDAHLLNLTYRQNIRICNINDFLNYLENSEAE